MNPWRRFLMWLAADEIDQAMEAGRLQEQLFSSMGRMIERQSAYLKGFHEGQQMAFDGIEEVIRARNDGQLEPATLADVAQAKKGVMH